MPDISSENMHIFLIRLFLKREIMKLMRLGHTMMPDHSSYCKLDLMQLEINLVIESLCAENRIWIL